MALIKSCLASGASGFTTYEDITSDFTTENQSGQYNRIKANTDIDYDFVVIYGTTDTTGAINTNIANDDILYTTLSSGVGGLQCSICKNVKSGDYIGRSTGSGTTSTWKVLGIK